jgi:uncharacterized Fe-S cluster-containing protein
MCTLGGIGFTLMMRCSEIAEAEVPTKADIDRQRQIEADRGQAEGRKSAGGV